MKFSSWISHIANDLMVESMTEDISKLTENIQRIIEDLKINGLPILEGEILRQLRYKGYMISEVIIKIVKDALQLEFEETKNISEG